MKEAEKMGITLFEKQIIEYVEKKTEQLNIDNISRTQAYATFYDCHPEIKWAFLASMVSRNAGWNMCDLSGKWMPKVLSHQTRDLLFLTYERANWLIFQDAFPQLLMYALSKKRKTSYFYLLSNFHVSSFIIEKWELFFRNKKELELMHALIINEQHVIQTPVIEQPFYKEKVFQSFLFFLQDSFHFSSVLFPTMEGELYGCSVHDFTKVAKRIELGKRLGALLFHPKYYPLFYAFSTKTDHTGSRHDYEQYFSYDKKRETPFLRMTYPIVSHHEEKRAEWFLTKRKEAKFMKKVAFPKKINVTKWYQKKQKQFHFFVEVKKLMPQKKASS
ncbi:DUF2515 domain-containing protein [Priestia megaterium]|nr:DUF2515 domain-containing protein [Priestia megaterium]